MKHPLLRTMTALVASLAVTAPALAQSAPLRADQVAFRGLYKELVETNTTVTNGSCTDAAAKMGARLKAAGFTDDRITYFATPEHPKDGGLVAVLPGSDAKLKPLLLLAHIDVVEAKRADWTRDPFTLIEENGYFYGRGTVDDKAQASIWTDTMVRFAAAGYKPKRTIKLALTCGEETSGAFNGAEWLAQNHKDWIDAEYALNEGGGGRTDGKGLVDGGKLVGQSIQIGEKAYQDFTLTATNPGGHSSAPPPDNAIYDLSRALLAVGGLEFPLQFNDVTRAYFAKAGAARGGELGAAMIALAKNPADKAAEAIVNKDKGLHSMLRTTCVATMVDAGHALNALPQRATANVNCRMFPGRTSAETMAALSGAIANPAIRIEERVKDKPIAVQPPLDPRIVGPVEKLAAKYYPGVPVTPTMSTGATDGVYLEAVGIPVYGVPSVWTNPDGNGTHGLNERVEVRALYTARDYLYDLVRDLSSK
ncbi:M20/M25/M40 family metallo-hydrolase [Parablastomonas sp. CN1-191]|uniref:M20/M25/M40 family metallo-hydrolase n=1 Tax=Parablastomonas sp. CN1-191 TaxID=3400908 RepID=UPI003BF7AA1F